MLLLLAVPSHVSAQLTTGDVGLDFATSTGLATTDVRDYIGRVVNAFFGLLGFVVVVLYLYAGFLWMTAGGDTAKVDQAKKVIANTTIGLVVIVLAYSITAFIIRALTGRSIVPGVGSGGGGGSPIIGLLRGGSSGVLGNGIIEYHYPEPGQTDVPRNTKISITFKQPLALSTVFRGYDDNGTYDLGDDTVDGGPVPELLELNTDNFKILPISDLGDTGGANPDERFDSRYPDGAALIDPPPTARVTAVAAVLESSERQTITISPVLPLGSAVTDMTYRVALRGGDNGVQVWSLDESGPVKENAFASMNADGGYNWSFVTGTTLDLTPPRITSVVPTPVINPAPARFHLPRNQLLQIYFNEAVDPTTASGIIGEGGGFTNIEVRARCLPDLDCDFNDGSEFTSVPGKIYIGNRYRTAEFVPSRPCEGVVENSCGEPVYCLPRNVELRVRVLSATLGPEPPSALRPDGVLDMVGNSFDGNGNGTAEGPESAERRTDFNRNDPPVLLAGINDTARWVYRVGEDMDLVPPVVMDIDPRSPPPADALHPAGPSRVPSDLPVTVLWSKTMSISSMRTGAYSEEANDFSVDRTTVALRAKERSKEDMDQDCSDPEEACPFVELDPPSFFLDFGDGPILVGDEDVSRMLIRHRSFLTANDLGYSDGEVDTWPDRLPTYQPVLGAKAKDTRQNCFYPSVGWSCDMAGDSSCCNRIGQDGYACPL
ncbi:MAG: pilin [bacterium]